MKSCPLCLIPEKESVLFENEHVYLVETKAKKGHLVRVMASCKRHTEEPTFEELSYAYAVIQEYMTNEGVREWAIVSSKYASIPDHFHLMACSVFTDDEEEAALYAKTPKILLPVTQHTLIGIPAHNEEGTVREVVEKAKGYGRVYVVDDGSDDDTVEEAFQGGADVLGVKHHGYGHALSLIFDEARRSKARSLVILDADGQHDPDEIPRFLEALKGADVVIGNRFLDEKDETPADRKRALNLMGKVARFEDSQCGFRAYGKKAIEKINITEKGFAASLEILHQIQTKKLKTKEVPCSVKYPWEPKRGILRHGVTLAETLLWMTVYRSPLKSLGLPSLIFTALGFVFSSMVVTEYLRARWFPIQTALLAGFTLLLGLSLGLTAVMTWVIKRSLSGADER